MAPARSWQATLRPRALLGSTLVHGGILAVVAGSWVLAPRAARGDRAPLRIEPSVSIPEVVRELEEAEPDLLESRELPTEPSLDSTQFVEVPVEPLFPEDPLAPLQAPPVATPWENAPPELLLALAPRQRDPVPEPLKEVAAAAPPAAPPAAPAVPPEEAQPRGLESGRATPEEIPGECEPPSYPSALAARGLSARVKVAITVGVDGRVRGVEILESSGHRPLIERAASAVLSWRYEPALEGGEPVEAVVEKTIVFDPTASGR